MSEIDSVHKNLLFIYEQLGVLWDAYMQLQKDNEVLRNAVDTLLEDALRRKFKEEREELGKVKIVEGLTHEELRRTKELYYGNSQ